MMVGATMRNVVSRRDAASGPNISRPPHRNICRWLVGAALSVKLWSVSGWQRLFEEFSNHLKNRSLLVIKELEKEMEAHVVSLPSLVDPPGLGLLLLLLLILSRL
jgi:hypothetical protein